MMGARERPTIGAAGEPISPTRDRRQSRLLTIAVTVALLFVVPPLLAPAVTSVAARRHALVALLLSLVFALAAWRLRAATPGAALLGLLICFHVTLAHPARATHTLSARPGIAPGLLALLTLFVLTFLATRFRRRAKERRGLAEPRNGRAASQIAANLGVAALCAAFGLYAGMLAALAEATADTVSSETGQALAGPTWLLTTFRLVPPGTDGGISLAGTLAGLVAAAAVVLAGCGGLPSPRIGLFVLLAAALGLLFDSLLGHRGAPRLDRQRSRKRERHRRLQPACPSLGLHPRRLTPGVLVSVPAPTQRPVQRTAMQIQAKRRVARDLMQIPQPQIVAADVPQARPR